jgi:hypothetical protein
VPVGSWSKNEIDIARHFRLFDGVWNASIACSNPVSSQHKVRLSEVMAADSAIDRHHHVHNGHNAVHEKIALIEDGLNSAAA